MANDAREEQMQIRDPSGSAHEGLASVIVRPVHMERLADLLVVSKQNSLARARQAFAEELTLLALRPHMNQIGASCVVRLGRTSTLPRGDPQSSPLQAHE